MPDEGLSTVKQSIIEHLQKDTHDPNSSALLETISIYSKQKTALHEQVKLMLSHRKYNTPAMLEKTKDMRETAIKTWQRLEADLTQKIKDDALLCEFQEGDRLYITLVGAEHLPMFDEVSCL